MNWNKLAAASVPILVLFSIIIEKVVRKPHGCFLSKSHTLHLTFDDGPVLTGTTREIMTTLLNKELPATFFIKGSLLERGTLRLRPLPPDLPEYSKYAQPDLESQNLVEARFKLLKEIQKSGFRIASHSFYHRIHNYIVPDPVEQRKLDQDPKKKVLYFKSESEMSHNLKKGKEIITDYLPGPISFIRLPFGAGTLSRSKKHDDHLNNPAVVKAYRSLGLRHIGWDIDSKDYYFTKLAVDRETDGTIGAQSRANLLFDHISKKVCHSKGGIILFHDTMPLTALYLDEWIEKLKKAGHRFVDLQDLYPRCFDTQTREFSPDNIQFIEERRGELYQCWTRL